MSFEIKNPFSFPPAPHFPTKQDVIGFASAITHSGLAQQRIDQAGQTGLTAGLTRVGTYFLPGITRALVNGNVTDAAPLLLEIPAEVGFALQAAFVASYITGWAPEFVQATAAIGGLAIGYLHAHTFNALIEDTLYQKDAFNPDGSPIVSSPVK